MKRFSAALLVLTSLVATGHAQQPGPGAPAARTGDRGSAPLPPLPQTYSTVQGRIRVSAIATGLSHPWSFAFLPDGSILVTERQGRLRIIRNGVLDPTPIAGVPPVYARALGGLLEVALHPKFADNKFIYLSYAKATENNTSTTVLARARFDGTALIDLKEIFVANTRSISNTNFGGRIAFDRSGLLYLTVGERQEEERAQKGEEHAGKVLRLRDDGSVPADNPFVGKAGYQPEIYSLGHRSPQGLVMNPDTGALWETEHGPNGGDEINILEAGHNYGWPVVTYGHHYDGTNLAAKPWHEGMDSPWLFWVPSIATSGITFYTGDRFRDWKGNVFVGGMQFGEIPRTGHLERIVFNEKGELRREWLLADLHQRIRDVRQGPDGLLYVLTDENAGALLRIEPVADPQP